MGTGIGWIDAHLLTVVSLATTVQLWTCDKRLRALAETLKISTLLL